MNCNTPGLPVHHQLPEFTQTHIHWVSDANQPSHPVVPFSSCLQSFPASGSFPMNQIFASGDQSIGVSASTSVLPMNTQGWSPLGWTGWISLQSKGLSKVFSNTSIQKHQFFLYSPIIFDHIPPPMRATLVAKLVKNLPTMWETWVWFQCWEGPLDEWMATQSRRIARRDKKDFLSNQCKEIEENNRMGKTRDLFKKSRDSKGTFHGKMSTIKDRNGMDITEAEDFKKRWKEYTEEL